MNVSAYVPFFNNKDSVLAALDSLQQQTIKPKDVFAVDDGSTDGGAELVEAHGFRCLRQLTNKGRGAARHRAMLEATNDLVVSCDATNILPSNFIEDLLPWFEDLSVVAAYGWIQDPYPKGAVSRWRARYLFKADHPQTVTINHSLITGGLIMRRSYVLAVGNFNPHLVQTEDGELGERLITAGHKIIFDPRVPVVCNVQNTLLEVLDRYWRWHAGIDRNISLMGYFKNITYSVKAMALNDLSQMDIPLALISLLCPHYQFFRSLLHR